MQRDCRFIATALGALPEMIEHDVMGMLVQARSAQAWKPQELWRRIKHREARGRSTQSVGSPSRARERPA
jgi:hypothetical protein